MGRSRCGKPFKDDTFSSQETNVRLVYSILRALIAIGGKPTLTSKDPRNKNMLVDPEVTRRGFIQAMGLAFACRFRPIANGFTVSPTTSSG